MGMQTTPHLVTQTLLNHPVACVCQSRCRGDKEDRGRLRLHSHATNAIQLFSLYHQLTSHFSHTKNNNSSPSWKLFLLPLKSSRIFLSLTSLCILFKSTGFGTRILDLNLVIALKSSVTLGKLPNLSVAHEVNHSTSYGSCED